MAHICISSFTKKWVHEREMVYTSVFIKGSNNYLRFGFMAKSKGYMVISFDNKSIILLLHNMHSRCFSGSRLSR